MTRALLVMACAPVWCAWMWVRNRLPATQVALVAAMTAAGWLIGYATRELRP